MRRLLAKIRKLLRDRRTRQMFTRIVSVTAAIVVFVTAYALVLPAITMEIEADCGIEAHQHDDSCYEYGLICGLEESDQHQHGDGCYGRTGNLICGKEVHVHSEACYHRNEAEVMTGEISEPDDGSLMTAVPSDAGGVSAQSADVFMEEGAEPEDGVLPEDAGDVLDENEPQYDAETGLEAEDQDEAGDAYAGEDGISEDYGTFEENGDESVDSAENFSDGTAEVVDGDIGADGNGGNIEAGNDLENAAGPAENGEYTESGEAAAIETGDPAESAEQSGIDSQAAPTDAEEFIPALDPVLFKEVLDDRTGIYYYHTPDGETVENSANITDWKKIRKDTELGGNDLLRVYLAYTIPAGSLNATNGTARYRLPGNLHLSDGQVNAINQMENGIAAQYADYTNLQILDPENYHKYLGAEAVDGTRTPDQSVDDYLQSLRSRGQAADGADTDGSEAGSANGSDGSDVQEFISATVQVENFYDTDGSSGEKGALLGQDLIFTFSPYTIEENRHAYDSTGQQTKIGRDVHGWLTLDFNMQQVDWIERESTVRTADIVFAAEGTGSQGHRISEIHTELTLVTEKVETITEDAENSNEETADSDDMGTSDSETDSVDNGLEANAENLNDGESDEDELAQEGDGNSSGDAGDKEDDRNYPAQSFEETITVRKGTLSTDAANDSAVAATAVDNIQKKTELTVSVVAEKGTFPEGTTMILTPVTGNDLDTVAEAVEGAVEGMTAGFHAVDISFRDTDGKEIEPRRPIKVSMQSESIRQAVENPSTDPVIVHLEDSKNKNDDGDNGEDADKEIPSSKEADEASGSAKDSTANNGDNSKSVNGLDDSAVTATTVPGSAEKNNLTFESDSFSVYAIVYTVDFHYEVNGKMYEFSIPGGGFVSFFKLVEVLGISNLDAQSDSEDEYAAENSEVEAGNGENTDGNAIHNVVEEVGVEDTGTYSDAISLNNVEVSETTREFVADVASVEFSSPEYVWVGKVEEATTVGGLKENNGLEVQYSAELTEDQIAEINSSTVEAGDWALISVLPFDTEESLKVTMKNGDQFMVKVTDAQKIPDAENGTIDPNKSYLICYQIGDTYYLLKNDGSDDSAYHPDFEGDTDAEHDFEHLNSTYAWSFNHIFKEQDVEHHLDKNYYLIRPIDDKSKTITLNNTDEALVQSGNNNVAVIQDENGFILEGYHNIGSDDEPHYVHLGFSGGAFAGVDGEGVAIHIYEMDSLPTYDYTVRSADEIRGTVTVQGGTQQNVTEQGTVVAHYWDATSNHDKQNAGTITATPVVHMNADQNKWEFDHWELDGLPLDRNQYGETISAESLPIPHNGSNLVAYFRQNPNYTVPPSEKEPSSIEDMTGWLEELQTRNIPLDGSATKKTAEVYDYQNRIYRVDFTSKANFETFAGNIDMAFCLDVSNSMYFPSALVETTSANRTNPMPIYQINNSGQYWSNQNWLDTSRNWNNPYYLVADVSGTATVFKIYYQDGYWKAQDASRETESNKSFRIGVDEFETNYGENKNYPFSKGDNSNTTYMIYDAGDDGKNRFVYLNQSLSGSSTDLNTIANLLAVAGDASPGVKIAYNTFNGSLGNQRQDFQSASSGLTVDLSYASGGGTRPDEAFNDAQNFSWSADYTVEDGILTATDRYVILVTDGAPQGGTAPSTGTVEDAVRTAATNLKTNSHVKFITVGLSMDNVSSGKRLLYDLADLDSNGNKMFYMAESGSDLENIFRQITKVLMEDAVVLGDITDTVGEGFYLVDKATGMPLEPGNTIDIEGNLTTDESRIAGVVQEDGRTIVWTDQSIDSVAGWHGTVYVKAQEELLGGNGMDTNDGTAEIVATKYRVGGKDVTFDTSVVRDTLNLTAELPSPKVNVNELTFFNSETEWTVYLGEEVDPKRQLKALYDSLVVEEVVNEDGSLHYTLSPNSIEERWDALTGTAATFSLPGLIEDLIREDPTLEARYYEGSELNWDMFLEDILADGITLPYHEFGLADGSSVKITLEKTIAANEEADLIDESPHDTTVTGDEVEKYVLRIAYVPDYSVTPIGQGGQSTADFHTGTFGTMYQGHAAGRESSTNTHIINVYSVPLDVYKTDGTNQPLAGATFKLYKEDESGAAVTGLDSTKKYIEVASATSETDGIARLKHEGEDFGLVLGETYYLIETEAPANYIKVNTVWAVEVQTEIGKFTNLDNEDIYSTITPDSSTIPPVVVGSGVTDDMYPFNWDQGARIMLDGKDPVAVIAKGETEGVTVPITDGSFVSHGKAVSFRHTVLNLIGGKVSITANKIWDDKNDPNRPASVNVTLYRVSEKDHVWGDGIVVPSTCTTEGNKQYTCSECGETETYVISAAGHTRGTAHRENETVPTCTEDGGYDTVVRCKVCNAIIETTHTDIPATGHTWIENQEIVSTDITKCYDTASVCSVCGAVDEATRVHHDHDWGEWQVTTAAQPGVAGEETRVCNHNESHVETREIPALPSETSITYKTYRDWFGEGWLEDDVTTTETYPINSSITLTWSSRESYTATVYINGTAQYDQQNAYVLSGNSVTATRTQSGGGYSRRYNYSVTVTVTDGMTLFLKSNSWDYYPTNITITQNRSLNVTFDALSLKSFPGVKSLLSAIPPVRSVATSSDPVQAYLDGISAKSDATCSETEGSVHTYKEVAGTYEIKASEDWTLNIPDLPQYNEYGMPYTYYVVETPVEGYETTYSGQENGLTAGTVTITNTKKAGSLKITKAVTVNDAATDTSSLTNGTYTFSISGVTGTPTAGISRTVSIAFVNGHATGYAIDDGSVQTVSGTDNTWSVVVPDLVPGSYTVSETDSGNLVLKSVAGGSSVTDHVATLTVTDGDTAAATAAAQVAFTNNIETVTISGSKTWVDSGRTHNNAQEITLTLKRTVKPVTEESVWETVPVSGEVAFAWNGNNYTYSNLLRYQNANNTSTEYEYKVEETSVHVTEVEGGNAQTIEYISSADGNNFTNTEVTTIEATKTWKDKEDPINGTITNASVTFELQRKNSDNSWTAVPQTADLTNPVIMSVEDTADAEVWKAEWSNLPKFELVEGTPTEIEYRVAETAVTLAGNSLTAGDPVNVTAGTANIDNYLPVDLTILKVDSNGMTKALKGATFTIQQIDETASVLSLISGTLATAETNGEIPGETGDDGVATFTGLSAGYYIVKETKLPAGYIQTDTGSFYIRVKYGEVKLVERDGTGWKESGGNEKLVFTAANGSNPASVKVGNEPGAELPSTGGPGTTLIYLLGILLTGLAGAGLAMRMGKRRRAE